VEDNGELQRINNRIQLSECEENIQNSIKEKHMLNGVTFINKATLVIIFSFKGENSQNYYLNFFLINRY